MRHRGDQAVAIVEAIVDRPLLFLIIDDKKCRIGKVKNKC